MQSKTDFDPDKTTTLTLFAHAICSACSYGQPLKIDEDKDKSWAYPVLDIPVHCQTCGAEVVNFEIGPRRKSYGDKKRG